VIVLDTHVWVWWVHGDPTLPRKLRDAIDAAESTGIGVSAISCWEVSKLVEYERLTLPCPLLEWLHEALAYPGVRLLELTPRICVESTQLPPPFHRDPADQTRTASDAPGRVHNDRSRHRAHSDDPPRGARPPRA
jgi:PIN domain nuclease of toxin-antitoxin system